MMEGFGGRVQVVGMPSNEPQAQLLEVLSGGNWFKNHPEKVLGQEFDTTNRFGKPVVEVKGTMKDVEKGISVPEVSAFPFVLTPDNPLAGQTQETQEDKIDQAISATEDERQNPPSTAGVELMSFEEVLKQSRGDMTDDEIAVWVNYQQGRLFLRSVIDNPENGWNKYRVKTVQPTDKDYERWVKKGYVAYDGREYIPSVIYYAGNIYEKIQELKKNKEKVVAGFGVGEKGFEAQLKRLEESKPEMLTLTAPEGERLYISPLDPFAESFTIDRTGDGVILDEPEDLISVFRKWIDTIPKEDFENKSGPYDVKYIFLQDERFLNGTSAEEKITRKRAAQQDGIALFQRFLFEMLTREDQQKLEYLWNSQFNAWQEYDYKAIPLGFELNKYFKNSRMSIRPAQMEGVKFQSVNGSGCIAYDVGVGKTMTAILGLGQGLYTGQFKRPLVVVPNPTYDKWIAETVGIFDKDGNTVSHGILPQYKDRVNSYYNLGVDYENKLNTSPPQDYSITFITFEGLAKLGLSKKAQEQIGDELYTILNQGGQSARDGEKLQEKIDQMMGTGTADTIADFDTLGFDAIIIDEAHNFKKVFTAVKGRKKEGDDKRGRNPYSLQSGAPSARGIKGFMLTQWILRNNAMRNVQLLTATPFTNSPLEIYSMLSLVAYQSLKSRGLESLIDFFDRFINETHEKVVTSKGTIESRAVIKGFNNLRTLQNIIFTSIHYKTGEEANVPRPVKVTYPLLKDKNGRLLSAEDRVDTALPPTPDQEYWLREISLFARAAEGSVIEDMIPESYYVKGKLPGRDLMAIGLAQACTLSPFLMRVGGEGGDQVSADYDFKPTYLEYIESSPKLQYVMQCVQSVKKHHESRNEPISGQVIYMNMATGFFPLIKQYLVEAVGYAKNEVEIISGGISAAKKERIKEKFLDGKVKIIIGSATIREGIDLQKKSTVLYNCALDWNPTDIQQLDGRIWRQGNQHSHVRIVVPLLENSIDVFMFQKLEEKTARINNIWYRAGRSNVLKLEELDPAELKKGLMTDPEQRALSDIDDQVKLQKFERQVAEEQSVKLQSSGKLVEQYKQAEQDLGNLYETAHEKLKERAKKLQENLDADYYTTKLEIDRFSTEVTRINDLLSSEQTDKVRYAIIKRYAKLDRGYYGGVGYTGQRQINAVDEQIKREKQLDSIQRNVLNAAGLKIGDNLEPLIEKYKKEVERIDKRILELRSKEYAEKLIAEYREEAKAALANRKDVKGRVEEFKKHNHLLSCIKDKHDCTLDGAGIPKLKVVPKGDLTEAELAKAAKAKAKALKLKLKLKYKFDLAA